MRSWPALTIATFPIDLLVSCVDCLVRRLQIHGWHSTASSAAATTRARRANATFVDVCSAPHAPLPISLHTPTHPHFADWDSEVNPMAADNKLRKQLLEVGPYCMADGGGIAYCSSNASRTQRSGMYDLKYMARDDRRYWCVNFSSLDRHRLTVCNSVRAQRDAVCA